MRFVTCGTLAQNISNDWLSWGTKPTWLGLDWLVTLGFRHDSNSTQTAPSLLALARFVKYVVLHIICLNQLKLSTAGTLNPFCISAWWEKVIHRVSGWDTRGPWQNIDIWRAEDENGLSVPSVKQHVCLHEAPKVDYLTSWNDQFVMLPIKIKTDKKNK